MFIGQKGTSEHLCFQIIQIGQYLGALPVSTKEHVS